MKSRVRIPNTATNGMMSKTSKVSPVQTRTKLYLEWKKYNKYVEKQSLGISKAEKCLKVIMHHEFHIN